LLVEEEVDVTDTAFSAALLAAQKRRDRLVLRHPASPSPTPAEARPPKPAPPRVEATPPKPEPVRKPEGGRTPEFVATFRRLAELVPPGKWPATLPGGFVPPDQVKAMALGISDRVKALLPEAEHAELHVAIGTYARSGFYLQALAADEAMRWSDDGQQVVEPVSEARCASATASLAIRAARRKAST
jgi:hypothetical protein